LKLSVPIIARRINTTVLKNYFAWTRKSLAFSKTEVLAYALLILILNTITLFMKWQRSQTSIVTPLHQHQLAIMDSLLAAFQPPPSGNLFAPGLRTFDPNTVQEDSLRHWGIPPNVARNLRKYREADGTFRAKQDLRKIYGMNDSLWDIMEPFVAIPLSKPSKKDSSNPSLQTARSIDINMADSLALMKIKGIGPVLSTRIIKYRRLLGGYYSKDQLDEVYGLSEEVLQRLKDRVYINPEFTYHKLSINSLDYRELARHPYISYTQARAIVAYREMHGSFDVLEKVKAIHLIGDSTYIKLYRYLDF